MRNPLRRIAGLVHPRRVKPLLFALAVVLSADGAMAGMDVTKAEPKPARLIPEAEIAFQCRGIAIAAADSMRLQQRQANQTGPAAKWSIKNAHDATFNECMMRHSTKSLFAR